MNTALLTPVERTIMLEALELAPPDPILGLTDAFRRDPNPAKINLGVGVFQDAAGNTPTLASVRKAEARLLERDLPKTYLPINGPAEYGRCVRELLFGEGHARVDDGTVTTLQSPGGTGALRLTGDFLGQHLGVKRIWMSDPTWANHGSIFQAAGLATPAYAYYDSASHGLAEEAMLKSLEGAEKGDAVLLHACCHNPTGVDPTEAQWVKLADLAERQGFLPVFDFAYQGFGAGLAADAAAVRMFADRGLELVVCSSFSKNFGLYSERVGALSLVAPTADAAARGMSQLKGTARANYSNPPFHGGAVVTTVLSDAELRTLWRSELDAMRDRISKMRALFVRTLSTKGVKQDFGFIEQQNGMFSFSGLSPEQVERLRSEFSIYAVRSGRINVAGMSETNMDRLCEAVAKVLSA